MRIARLKLANLRAIEAMELRFAPGVNLIVGVNGVGKTSILDALSVCLSAVVKDANGLRLSTEPLTIDDIRIGAKALTLECEVQIGEANYTYLLHRPREMSAPQRKKEGMPRESVHATPERSQYLGPRPFPVKDVDPSGRPLALLFSTRRALASDRLRSSSAAAGGWQAAYAEAFASRELRLAEFAAWLRVQQRYRGRTRGAGRVIDAFEEAVQRFLPGYSNLKATDEKTPRLVIERGQTRLAVRQLSDGERGTLAMVLDLTRRLAQANPEMGDPAADAEAVVLIDEIDLHLHPQWQRKIVQHLSITFPKCQFIATTHSPQVIGEIEPDRIQILSDGNVYSPPVSFGMDSSRVLEEVMDTPPRTATIQKLLSDINKAITDRKFANARRLLAKLARKVGETDADVTRLRTLLEFMGDGA